MISSRRFHGRMSTIVGPGRVESLRGRIGMCVPGQEAALLVRVAVDGEVEEVGADAAVVEQGVALARARRSRRPLALRAARRSGTRAASAWSPRTLAREGRRSARASSSPAALLGSRSASTARLVGCDSAPACRRVDPQRTAVGGQLLDVEHPRPWAAKMRSAVPGARSTRSARGRSCRTGSRRRAAGGGGTRSSPRRPVPAASAMPATKSLRSGTWASTLLPTTRSAAVPSSAQLARPARRRRTATSVGTPRGSADRGDVRGGLDAEHRHARRHEVLEQVAVVAAELDDQAVRAETEAAR